MKQRLGKAVNVDQSAKACGAPSQTALSFAAPCAPELLQSSESLGWSGFTVERHRNSPGVPGGDYVDRPVLIMLCSPTSEYEYKGETGGFVYNRKTHGALTVFPTGPVPQIRLLVPSEFAYCALNIDFVKEIIEEMEGPLPDPIAFRTNRHDSQLRDIFQLLLSELDTRVVKEPLYIESLAHALAVKVLKLGSPRFNPDKPFKLLPCAARISRLKERIDAQLDQPLTLKTLAAECGYSRAYFLRWFCAQTGVRPHEYVLNQRLERAARYLSMKKMALTDIAAECGFSSQSHMTTAFRKRFGLTPAAYRNEAAL